ncbi:hypothetical protein COEREDRAFT_80102 [Coemansia reversa NRRL 1564]|uniref:RRM domain-containing protein n=1 Tax=Coemansia reversa (strain ATCC 12441 / NRRL 1564) TaxID=763665 RepID=A0A2G5BGN4_COERN|nr:hypothetical protein COEREDRAFT_80102 [Coemansia reversa NRRL 1564]|eukprot:PIA18198.1 hypothetical protein COEREDRAFT_80102 [Coemansia reversa NRRL 1564]
MASPMFPKPSEFATDKRVQFIEETSSYIFTDPKYGIEYEFDQDKGAWFPMWNESLVDQQQSAYGIEQPQDDDKRRNEKQNAKRKDVGRSGKRDNTVVYVSGLPLDTTAEEVAEYFSQCGALMPDIVTNKPRIKLYCDDKGGLKGDALVTYFKAPSVQLAVDILDDSQFRANSPARINVEQAEFKDKPERKDEKDAAKKPRIDPKLVQRRLNQLERKLDWFEGTGEIADRHKRTVVLKHMFTLEELQADVTLLLDLSEDVRSECEKLGKVTSVKVYDQSDEGVIAVKFKDELAARACVKMMNGRFFGGRQVEAAIYDGHTRYKSTEALRPDANTELMGENDDDVAGGEETRMEKYAHWLDSGN